MSSWPPNPSFSPRRRPCSAPPPTRRWRRWTPACPAPCPPSTAAPSSRPSAWATRSTPRSAPPCSSSASTTSTPTCPRATRSPSWSSPSSHDGHLDIETAQGEAKRVRINRAHIEEDAGKSLHEGIGKGHTGVDLNRAGMPLLEIVTEPDLAGPEEAVLLPQAAAPAGALVARLARAHGRGLDALRRQCLGAARRRANSWAPAAKSRT